VRAFICPTLAASQYGILKTRKRARKKKNDDDSGGREAEREICVCAERDAPNSTDFRGLKDVGFTSGGDDSVQCTLLTSDSDDL
jgi:hypothetical protein